MSETTSNSIAAPNQTPRVSLETLARNLRLSVIDVLWRQWRAVDAQAAGKGRAHAMVDPEALVLMSLLLMEDERRLRDLIESWATWNSDLLSVQRAKNLAANYPDQAREKLAWFAEVALEQGKDMRWRSLARPTRDAPVAGVSPRKNKERAIRVRLAEPAALLLRLRLGFGVGTKADVLGYLLGIEGKSASVRDISSATVYTVAAIRRATEDMAVAHLIHSTTGPPVAYRADPSAWRRVLALKGQPPWRNWHQRFAFAAAFLAWTEALTDTVSDYAAGVKGRELMQQHRSAFALDLLAAVSDHDAQLTDRLGFLRNAVTSFANSMRADA
jgi:hypothetical protein